MMAFLNSGSIVAGTIEEIIGVIFHLSAALARHSHYDHASFAGYFKARITFFELPEVEMPKMKSPALLALVYG